MQIDALKKLFAQSGLKFTNQRYLVYKAMVEARDHPSAETVWRRVRESAPAISLDTVYRTLGALDAAGIIQRVPVDGDQARYDGDVSPHHHMVCARCRSIVDFLWPDFDLDCLPEEARHWGRARDAQVIVRGECQACLASAKGLTVETTPASS